MKASKKLVSAVLLAVGLGLASSAMAGSPAGVITITVVNNHQAAVKPLKIKVSTHSVPAGSLSLRGNDTLNGSDLAYGASGEIAYGFTDPGQGWNNPYQISVSMKMGSKKCVLLVEGGVQSTSAGLQPANGGLCALLKLNTTSGPNAQGNTSNYTVYYN